MSDTPNTRTPRFGDNLQLAFAIAVAGAVCLYVAYQLMRGDLELVRVRAIAVDVVDAAEQATGEAAG